MVEGRRKSKTVISLLHLPLPLRHLHPLAHLVRTFLQAKVMTHIDANAVADGRGAGCLQGVSLQTNKLAITPIGLFFHTRLGQRKVITYMELPS